jgi:PST family polysaccharide transporter
MHAGFGPIRGSQTTGSMVSHLDPVHPTHFFTGTAAPCTGLFCKGCGEDAQGARPLNQHAYPRLVRALDGHGEPSRAALSIVLRHTVPQLLALAVLLGVVAGGVPLLWHLLPAGTDTGQVRAIHRVALVMAPSVLLGVANFMLGTAGLNALGRRRYLAGAILATGLANLVAASALIHLLGAMGAAMAFVLSEALLCVLVVRAYRAEPLAPRA